MFRFRVFGVGVIVVLLLAGIPPDHTLADAKVRVRSFIPKNQDTVPVSTFTVFNVKTQVFVLDGTITNVIYRTLFSCEVTVTFVSVSQGSTTLGPTDQDGFCTRLVWVIGTLVGTSTGDTPVATMEVELSSNSGEFSPAGEHTIKHHGRLHYDEGINAFTINDNEIVITAE